MPHLKKEETYAPEAPEELSQQAVFSQGIVSPKYIFCTSLYITRPEGKFPTDLSVDSFDYSR